MGNSRASGSKLLFPQPLSESRWGGDREKRVVPRERGLRGTCLFALM